MLFNSIFVLFLFHLYGANGGIEWEIPPAPCEVVDAVNFIKTFGRSATPDHFNTTIDRLWIDTMTSPGIYGKAMDGIIFDLMRINRFYFIDAVVMYLEQPDDPGVLNVILQYYVQVIDAFKIKLAGYFCAHHRCENSGMCDLQPLEDILSYRTVLSLPGLQDKAMEILRNEYTRTQYFENFDIIPNVLRRQMPSWDWDPYFPFRAIFTNTDLGILRQIMSEVSGDETDQIFFPKGNRQEVVFDGESLAFLGKVLMAITEITDGKLSPSQAAKEFVTCKCPFQYQGHMCGDEIRFDAPASCSNSLRPL